MNSAERQLAALREVRDAARADLLARVDAAKALAQPRVLGQRLRQEITHHGRNAVAQAMEIAADNRGVLAGTMTALLVWLARKQIFARAVKLAPRAVPFLTQAKTLAIAVLAKVDWAKFIRKP